ncbi:unnamed protein product [Caenorhabditis brenneri]
MSDKSESSQNASPARERTESVESPESPPPSDRPAEQRPTSTAQSIISTSSEEGPTSSYGPSENNRMTTGDCEAENRRSQLMQVWGTTPLQQSEDLQTGNHSPSTQTTRQNQSPPPETHSQMSASSNVSVESMDEIVSVGVRTGMQPPSQQSSSQIYSGDSQHPQPTPFSNPLLQQYVFGSLDNVSRMMAEASQNVSNMMMQYDAPTHVGIQVVELDDEDPTSNVNAKPSDTKQDNGEVNSTVSDESESVTDESKSASDENKSASDGKESASDKNVSVSDEQVSASDKSASVADEDNSPIIEASSSEELFEVEEVDSDGEVHRTKHYRRKPADRRVRRVRPVRSSTSSDDAPPPKKSKEDLSKKSKARDDQESSSGSSSDSQVLDEESSPDASSSSSSTSSWEAKRRKRRLQESSSSQSPLSDD